ncbi:hypothetical protein BDQ12DRAFT_685392 [Crucibulum laeve]|uniref:Uncharacterized protein n=1 Tax=Crucibulum laeve TaxID=68775 RepID=A0A5C3LX21_9AGAR|nr:hypothetical protein BDQ12DRAFT_685392 [Crucibulum laeve]
MVLHHRSGPYVEAMYAVKYPRAVLPPRPSPMQTKIASKSTAAMPKHPFKVLSPNIHCLHIAILYYC